MTPTEPVMIPSGVVSRGSVSGKRGGRLRVVLSTGVLAQIARDFRNMKGPFMVQQRRWWGWRTLGGFYTRESADEFFMECLDNLRDRGSPWVLRTSDPKHDYQGWY